MSDEWLPAVTGPRSTVGRQPSSRRRGTWFGHVYAHVKDLRLLCLLVLGQRNGEAFFLHSVLAFEQTDRALALLICGVADATFVAGRPAGCFHAFVCIEVLHRLRVLVGSESNEVYLALHHGADQQTRAERNFEVGPGGAREGRHVGPQLADSSSLGVAAQVLDKAAGDGDGENKN